MRRTLLKTVVRMEAMKSFQNTKAFDVDFLCGFLSFSNTLN